LRCGRDWICFAGERQLAFLRPYRGRLLLALVAIFKVLTFFYGYSMTSISSA
jgi:hypothetical protein